MRFPCNRFTTGVRHTHGGDAVDIVHDTLPLVGADAKKERVRIGPKNTHAALSCDAQTHSRLPSLCQWNPRNIGINYRRICVTIANRKIVFAHAAFFRKICREDGHSGEKP